MKCILASLLLLTASALCAEMQPAGVGPLTLDEAVSLAVRDNARLRSLRAKTRAMQSRTIQDAALPDPMLSYSGMDMKDSGNWPDTGEKRLMVQQAFPWFGKRTLRGEIAGKDADAMQRELDAMMLDVVSEVKETYSDLYAVQQVADLTRKEESVLRRILEISETMYAAGDRPQTDAIMARTELAMLHQKLLELAAQENMLKARLNVLLNRRADRPLEPAGKPPEAVLPDDVTVLLAGAAKSRPEILGAQAQVERYALEKRLMQKEYLPDYAIGLEYRSLRADEDMLMFTVSVELPLWPSKNRAGVLEAAEMQVYSQAAREAAEQQASFDVQDASFRLRTAMRTLERYRSELIPQAEARFSASESAYRTGRADLMDLLESERFLLNVKIMAAMTEGAVGVQAAKLERAVGGALK